MTDGMSPSEDREPVAYAVVDNDGEVYALRYSRSEAEVFVRGSIMSGLTVVPLVPKT